MPPTNHFANGGFHSNTCDHLLNQMQLPRRQLAPESLRHLRRPARYSSRYPSIPFTCALRTNSALGGYTFDVGIKRILSLEGQEPGVGGTHGLSIPRDPRRFDQVSRLVWIKFTVVGGSFWSRTARSASRLPVQRGDFPGALPAMGRCTAWFPDLAFPAGNRCQSRTRLRTGGLLRLAQQHFVMEKVARGRPVLRRPLPVSD